MSLNMDNNSAISVLERWFKEHCDGTWEHHLGIVIETTDNPGWVLTFKELRLTKEAIADVIGDLLRQYDSQVGTDGMMVRVFGPSLQQVLLAAAVLAERSDSSSDCSEAQDVSQKSSDDDKNSHN